MQSIGCLEYSPFNKSFLSFINNASNTHACVSIFPSDTQPVFNNSVLVFILLIDLSSEVSYFSLLTNDKVPITHEVVS